MSVTTKTHLASGDLPPTGVSVLSTDGAKCIDESVISEMNSLHTQNQGSVGSTIFQLNLLRDMK